MGLKGSPKVHVFHLISWKIFNLQNIITQIFSLLIAILNIKIKCSLLIIKIAEFSCGGDINID